MVPPFTHGGVLLSFRPALVPGPVAATIDTERLAIDARICDGIPEVGHRPILPNHRALRTEAPVETNLRNSGNLPRGVDGVAKTRRAAQSAEFSVSAVLPQKRLACARCRTERRGEVLEAEARDLSRA